MVAVITGAQLQVNLFVNNNELSGKRGQTSSMPKEDRNQKSAASYSFSALALAQAANGGGGGSWCKREGKGCCFLFLLVYPGADAHASVWTPGGFAEGRQMNRDELFQTTTKKTVNKKGGGGK